LVLPVKSLKLTGVSPRNKIIKTAIAVAKISAPKRKFRTILPHGYFLEDSLDNGVLSSGSLACRLMLSGSLRERNPLSRCCSGKVLYARSFECREEVDDSEVAVYTGGGSFIRAVLSENKSRSVRRGDVGDLGIYELGEDEGTLLERADT